MLTKAAMLFDPGALVVVLAGTVLATMARCGVHELRAAMIAVATLFSPGFDKAANRAALARTATAIHERGHFCAETTPPPDPATARLVEVVVMSGSIRTLPALVRAQRTGREVARFQAQRVFEYAGELAPVFGLVGTLFAITQLTPTAGLTAAQTTMASVATAVLSSLYGVLTAHLLYFPLARAIERRGEREERDREELIDWFEDELTGKHATPVRPTGSQFSGKAA